MIKVNHNLFWLFILTAFLFAGNDSLAAPGPNWTTDVRTGDEFTELKKYSEAEKHYVAAVRNYPASLHPASDEYLGLLNKLVRAYYAQEKYQEAVPYVKAVLTSLEERFGSREPSVEQARENYKQLLERVRVLNAAQPRTSPSHIPSSLIPPAPSPMETGEGTTQRDQALSPHKLGYGDGPDGPEIIVRPSRKENGKDDSGSGHSVESSADVDFGPYMADIQRRIKKHWFPPRGCESKRVVVAFRISTINSCAALSSLRVYHGSGIGIADNAALKAVEDAAPFRPLPAGAPESVEVQFTFDYNVFNGTGHGVFRQF